MNYFINEYSLRGQFSDIDDFFLSLREYTMPVLKRLETNCDNIIIKKDTFWQSEICHGITLNNIPIKRNERSPEKAALQMKLIKLINQNPYWSEEEVCDFEVKEYGFDKLYSLYFSNVNCFTKGIQYDGNIISFLHPEYKIDKLGIIINKNGKEFRCNLDNIFSDEWWRTPPLIQTWRIENKYILEIRANEFDFHPPHFHVTFKEYAAVFRLSDGQLYTSGRTGMPKNILDVVGQWYKDNKDLLITAWNTLHPKNK